MQVPGPRHSARTGEHAQVPEKESGVTRHYSKIDLRDRQKMGRDKRGEVWIQKVDRMEEKEHVNETSHEEDW